MDLASGSAFEEDLDVGRGLWSQLGKSEVVGVGGVEHRYECLLGLWRGPRVGISVISGSGMRGDSPW